MPSMGPPDHPRWVEGRHTPVHQRVSGEVIVSSMLKHKDYRRVVWCSGCLVTSWTPSGEGPEHLLGGVVVPLGHGVPSPRGPQGATGDTMPSMGAPHHPQDGGHVHTPGHQGQLTRGDGLQMLKHKDYRRVVCCAGCLVTSWTPSGEGPEHLLGGVVALLVHGVPSTGALKGHQGTPCPPWVHHTTPDGWRVDAHLSTRGLRRGDSLQYA